MTDENTFRLLQHSSTGDPGFKLFKAKDDGLYYFHLNDEKGDAILFSQGYSTAKERTATRNALRKRMPVKSSYKRKSQDGAYYFTVVNKQKEAIARSKTFDNKESRELLIEKLQQGSNMQGTTNKVKFSSKESVQSEQGKKGLNPPSPKGPGIQHARYRFNITFRKVADEAPLLGEIQFPIGEGKSTFQGFDVDAIQQFISQHLPDDTSAFSKKQQKEKDAIKAELYQAIKAEQEKAAKQAGVFKQQLEAANKQKVELVKKLEAANKKETELRKEFEANTSALKEQFQIRTSALEKSLENAQERIKLLEKEPQAAVPAEKEETSSEEAMINDRQAQQFQNLLDQEQAKLKKPLALIVGEQQLDHLNLSKTNSAVKLLLTIAQPEEQQIFEHYRAIFQIKSMDSGRINYTIRFAGKLNQQNQILVSANNLSACDPGLYRLIIRIFPSNPAVPNYEIVGKRVVFITK